MTINEVTSINAPITIITTNNDGTTTTNTVINLYATIDVSNMSISLGATTLDKVMAADPTCAETIKEQYQEFISTVQEKAAGFGFAVFTA
jgi:hypothetical protein